MSPMYWMYNMRKMYPDFDKQPPEVKQAWIDGCFGANAGWSKPSMLRYYGRFFMHPEYVKLPLYRDTYARVDAYCKLRFGHALNSYSKDRYYLANYGGYVKMRN